MNIWIVRHGETDKNREKLLQGRSNAPLNENGIRQAEAVRDFFRTQETRMDTVYASPLLRAVQTARIVAGDETEIITDEFLLEMDYGPYEGASLENPALELLYFFSDFVHHPAPEGMESLEHVKTRMGVFLERIKASGADHILIATHAIAMKGALEYLTPESNGAYWSKTIGTCTVYHSVYDGRQFAVPEEVFAIGHEPGV